jgi:uncharacterized membrane protein YidH (DUF202 family)
MEQGTQTISGPHDAEYAGAVQRTAMAAERTWLAWWRSALVATAGALAVGRVTPRVLHVATWPYVALGIGYAVLAVGLLAAGAYRQRSLQAGLQSGVDAALDFRVVAAFSIGGVLLALCTTALVLAQA